MRDQFAVLDQQERTVTLPDADGLLDLQPNVYKKPHEDRDVCDYWATWLQGTSGKRLLVMELPPFVQAYLEGFRLRLGDATGSLRDAIPPVARSLTGDDGKSGLNIKQEFGRTIFSESGGDDNVYLWNVVGTYDSVYPGDADAQRSFIDTLSWSRKRREKWLGDIRLRNRGHVQETLHRVRDANVRHKFLHPAHPDSAIRSVRPELAEMCLDVIDAPHRLVARGFPSVDLQFTADDGFFSSLEKHGWGPGRYVCNRPMVGVWELYRPLDNGTVVAMGESSRHIERLRAQLSSDMRRLESKLDSLLVPAVGAGRTPPPQLQMIRIPGMADFNRASAICQERGFPCLLAGGLRCVRVPADAIQVLQAQGIVLHVDLDYLKVPETREKIMDAIIAEMTNCGQ